MGVANLPASTQSRAWLFGALGLVLLRGLPSLRYPLGRDQATYCVIGQGLLRGQFLYRDLWDIKPPGIFYIYSIIVRIFGPVMWSVGIIDIIWLLAISICIFYFAKHYLGAPAAAVAVIINALWHCSWGYIHAAQAEPFITLFVFLSYFILMSEQREKWRGNLFVGLMFGAAFWVKYNSALFFPILPLLPYLDLSRFDEHPRRLDLAIPWRAWFQRTESIVAGFLLMIFAVLAYFWGIGAWPAMKEEHFEILPLYGSMFMQHMGHYPLFALTVTRYNLGPWTEAAFGAALLIAWGRRELRIIAPVIIMAVAGFATTASQPRLSSYSFETAYPFFAMLWGYVLVKLCVGFIHMRKSIVRRGWRVAAVLLWLVAAEVVYYPVPSYAYDIVEDYQGLAAWISDPSGSYKNYAFQFSLEKLHDQMAAIDYLRQNSVPSDGVYVWGTAPLINFLTQRPSPSRFVANHPLISPWGPPHCREVLMAELNSKPPRFILVERHDQIPLVTLTNDDSEQCLRKYPALASFIADRYESVDNLDDLRIYRLKRP
jgi:Dolichyl-phosphate-mannose-protein mannosyltransferase